MVRMLLAGAALAVSQADNAAMRAPDTQTLMQQYLQCEEAVLTRRPVGMEIAHCSTIYEKLKVDAFDGDWQKLRRWYEETKNGS